MKEVLSLVATLLIFAAYLPYIRDILRGKTIPHPYTWFASGFVTFIVFGLQLSDGAGWGSIPTFVGAAAGIIIFILSLLQDKKASITKSDTFFFILALIATGLWLVADQPLLSVILVSAIDILAFIPTFRKSWHNPEQETISAYVLNTLRFAFATIAVEKYTLITVLYPLSSGLADGFMVVYLLARRRKMQQYIQRKG